MFLVLGEENRGSTSAADLANDAVSAGENRLGCRELMERHHVPGRAGVYYGGPRVTAPYVR